MPILALSFGTGAIYALARCQEIMAQCHVPVIVAFRPAEPYTIQLLRGVSSHGYGLHFLQAAKYCSTYSWPVGISLRALRISGPYKRFYENVGFRFGTCRGTGYQPESTNFRPKGSHTLISTGRAANPSRTYISLQIMYLYKMNVLAVLVYFSVGKG